MPAFSVQLRLAPAALSWFLVAGSGFAWAGPAHHDEWLAKKAEGPVLTQPTRSLKELYNLSRRSLPLYRRKMAQHAIEGGAELRIAPLKSRARAIEKIESQFHGDSRRLTDPVRGALLFSTAGDLWAGLDRLRTREDVVKVTDHFSSRDTLGYRHVNVRFRLPNKLIVEAQLTTKPFFEAFHGEHGVHGLYEEYRTLRERLALDGKLSSVDEKRYAHLGEAMQLRLAAVE